jgi:hypothetical protein
MEIIIQLLFVYDMQCLFFCLLMLLSFASTFAMKVIYTKDTFKVLRLNVNGF